MIYNKKQYIQKNIHKNTLKELSDRFNFDFNKNILIVAGFGKFTHKKLLELGNITEEKKAIILIYSNQSHFKEWRAAGISVDGFDLVKFYGTNAGDYWRKIDLEDHRKEQDVKYILVVQNYEDLRQRRPQKNIFDDLNQRIKTITKINRWSDANGNNNYIGDIEYLNEFNGEKEVMKGTFTCHETDITNLIDKSGYLKYLYIRQLKERNKQRIAERKKQEAAEEDLTQKQAEAEEEAEKINNKIIKMFNTSNLLYKDVNNIESVIYIYKWLLYDIQNFTERAANKKFDSIEQINRKYAEIMEQVKKANEKIKEYSYLLED